MEWILADSLIVDPEKKLTIAELAVKQRELEQIGLENTPPILIDERMRIVDGVKRYAVLVKNRYEEIPVRRIGRTSRVHLHLNVERTLTNPLKIAA